MLPARRKEYKTLKTKELSTKGFLALATIVFLTASSAAGARAGLVCERETLRGLEGIAVTVMLESGMGLRDLSEIRLQTDIESQLRRAGITVLTRQDLPDVPAHAVLYVNVNLLKCNMMYVYTVTTQVHQAMVLKRNSSMQSMASTWDASRLTFAGLTDPSDKIRSTVSDLVQAFVSDYLAENPK